MDEKTTDQAQNMTPSFSPGRTRRWATKIAQWFVVALLLFALYHALFGRFFPLSPIILGFSRQEYISATVYHHGQYESSQLSYLNDVIPYEETYHGISFRWKPAVFLCKDDCEYRRLTGSKARFTSINGRVFVSQQAQDDARQGKIVLRTYLTHELSHCLLQQRVSILRSMRMPKWLLEGTAMDCARQVGTGNYPAKSTVYELIAGGAFCEPSDFGTYLNAEKGTALSCSVENKATFFYSEFGCFVEFLRSSHGAQRYRAFLEDVVECDNLDVEESFVRVFGIPLSDEFRRFTAQVRKAVLRGSTGPRVTPGSRTRQIDKSGPCQRCPLAVK
jgi:hypothetical protein